MNPFLTRGPTISQSAVGEICGDTAANFIAGGTNLIDLMKENVARPDSPDRHQSRCLSIASKTLPTADCGSARS